MRIENEKKNGHTNTWKIVCSLEILEIHVGTEIKKKSPENRCAYIYAQK